MKNGRFYDGRKFQVENSQGGIGENRLRSSSESVAGILFEQRYVKLILFDRTAMAILQVSAPALMEWDSRNGKSIHGLLGSQNQISNINLDFLLRIEECPTAGPLSHTPFRPFLSRIPGSLHLHLRERVGGGRWPTVFSCGVKLLRPNFPPFFSFSRSLTLSTGGFLSPIPKSRDVNIDCYFCTSNRPSAQSPDGGLAQ